MVTRSSSQLVVPLIVLVIMTVSLPECDASKAMRSIIVQPGSKHTMNEAVKSKDMLTANPVPAEVINIMKLGGRKMMMNEGKREIVSNEMMKQISKQMTTSVEAPSSTISGSKDMAKYLKNSPAASPVHMDYQNDAEEKPDDVSDSNGSALKKANNGSFQNLDTTKQWKATSQMVNLLDKDYPGGGGPGYKPPINNHEPLH